MNRTTLHVSRKFTLERWSEEAAQVAGETGRTWDIVVHPGAAVILPWLDDGRIVLIRNRRVAVVQTLLELPAGTLDPPEPPIEAARRELAEETGYRAATLTPLMTFFSTPGFTTEQMHVFEARGLTPGLARPEADEQIETVAMEYDLALREVERGGIVDAKTMLVLLHYDRFRRES